MKPFYSSLAALILFASAAAVAEAAPAPVGLTGTTQYDGWSGFNSTAMPGYGTYPGASAWNSGSIGSNAAGSADAFLSRVSGSGSSGPYVASSSIYFAGPGVLSVSDTTPVANLANVVFQLDVGGDFTAGGEPTLSYNGGTAGPAPTRHVGSGGVGALDPDGNPAETTTWLYQWDLSGLSNITSYSVEWGHTQHSQIYAVQLDQSDAFAAVPEPGSLGLAGLVAVGLLGRRRRASLA